MANQQHFDWLSEGAPWENLKRQYLADVHLDLSGADLRGRDLQNLPLGYANLSRADLSGANMKRVHLVGANLVSANLESADLGEASMVGADLSRANLTNARLPNCDLTKAILNGANLAEACFREAMLHETKLAGTYCAGTDFSAATLAKANLSRAYLFAAKFPGAILRGANLSFATLVKTNLSGTDLSSAFVYGVSAWDIDTDEHTSQQDLYISREPNITVDDLEVAQFVNLCLDNNRVRNVIDTLTAKAVLVLGCFSEKRKKVLDALRAALRSKNYLAILFDFEQPPGKNKTETVSTIAHLSRFVIADISDARSIAQELQRIVPDNPSVPVQPLIHASQYEYALFKDLLDYPWVLKPYRYDGLEELLATLDSSVVAPAIAKENEIRERRKAFEQELGAARESTTKT